LILFLFDTVVSELYLRLHFFEAIKRVTESRVLFVYSDPGLPLVSSTQWVVDFRRTAC